MESASSLSAEIVHSKESQAEIYKFIVYISSLIYPTALL